jgi:hypothetical protein
MTDRDAMTPSPAADESDAGSSNRRSSVPFCVYVPAVGETTTGGSSEQQPPRASPSGHRAGMIQRTQNQRSQSSNENDDSSSESSVPTSDGGASGGGLLRTQVPSRTTRRQQAAAQLPHRQPSYSQDSDSEDEGEDDERSPVEQPRPQLLIRCPICETQLQINESANVHVLACLELAQAKQERKRQKTK